MIFAPHLDFTDFFQKNARKMKTPEGKSFLRRKPVQRGSKNKGFQTQD